MARLSMNEVTTFRWSFEEDVRNYEAAGLDGIGVWRQKLSDFGEARGAELLADSSLHVSCILWAGGFTGGDGRTYRESVDDAIEAVKLAAELQADALIVYSGSRSGHTQNHARRLFRHALDELVPEASQRGVTLAIEPMHAGCASEWTFLTGLDETFALLEAIDSPHLKLAFDAYHLGQTPEIVGRLAELVPRIGMVQLGDARHPPNGEQNRCKLGEGLVPLRDIVCELINGNYDGYFDVELMGEDVEDLDYLDLIEQSKDVFTRLTDVAG